jgi:hypothetical protein
MGVTRTPCAYRIDTWTPDGESIVEHVAGIEDYQVALATFRAAYERWPGKAPRGRRPLSARTNPDGGRGACANRVG